MMPLNLLLNIKMNIYNSEFYTVNKQKFKKSATVNEEYLISSKKLGN